jgi:signal transduction histidine kinase
MVRPVKSTDAILVVDDDAGMRETIVEILEMHGFSGVGVGTGAEAVAAQVSIKPAVAVVDHGLPDMTGLELCGMLKAEDADLQVVVLTGRATLEDAIAAVGQADEFLTKPAPPTQLVRVIEGALTRRSLRRENLELIVRLQQANASLHESISDRTADLSGLERMATAVARAQTVDDVSAAVVRAAVDATSAAGAAIHVVDPATGQLVRRAAWPEAWSADVDVGSNSVLSVDLIVAGERLGVLTLDHPRRSNASFVQTVAVEAAVALQNAGRFARERETVERLSEISELKSAFLASVSHELRTPLTAVVGFAQTLGTHGDRLSPDERRNMLERIVVQGERLRRLITNLLDSTALETGTLRVAPTPVDGAAVVRRVVDALGDHHPPVVLDIPDSLPPLWADEGRLEQVLGNLIDNAVKHSPAEEPITVSAVSTKGRITLSISDRGPGIEPAFLSRLFDPFTQADSEPNRRNHGVGLGLFIARGLVTAMGGSLTAASTLGEGASFGVELPAAPG